jgi:hypothetical protein
MPTDEDWDTLAGIVHDLEETLMGNPNTLWGYQDRLAITAGGPKVGAGNFTRVLFTVPEGYAYVVTAILSRNDTTAVETRHELFDGATYYAVNEVGAQPANTWLITKGVAFALKEDDRLAITWVGCQDGDFLVARVWGYKMAVP